VGSGICESPCSSNADCLNAASICSQAEPARGSQIRTTCVVNGCLTGTVGQECDSGDGAGGTCVPYNTQDVSEEPKLVCVPTGTATVCTGGASNDDPFTRSEALLRDAGFLSVPQPRIAADFCGPGAACSTPMGVSRGPGQCERLCAWPEDGGRACAAPEICVTQDPNALWWGFCLPCGASTSDGGPAANCNVSSDCCEGKCVFGAGTLGLCSPGQDT